MGGRAGRLRGKRGRRGPPSQHVLTSGSPPSPAEGWWPGALGAALRLRLCGQAPGHQARGWRGRSLGPWACHREHATMERRSLWQAIAKASCPNCQEENGTVRDRNKGYCDPHTEMNHALVQGTAPTGLGTLQKQEDMSCQKALLWQQELALWPRGYHWAELGLESQDRSSNPASDPSLLSNLWSWQRHGRGKGCFRAKVE